MAVYRSPDTIILDVHAQSIKTPVFFVTGDVNAYPLLFKIVDGGVNAYDLTDKTVAIVCKVPNNPTPIVDGLTITDPVNGLCHYTVKNSIYASPGEIQAELHIFDGDNNRLSTCTFYMTVRQGIDDSSGIEASDNYPILVQLIAEVQRLHQTQTYVEGENNLIDGSDNIVYGNNNQIIGSNNLVIGDNLIIIGNNKLIMGSSNLYLNYLDTSNRQIYYYIDGGVMPLSVGDKVCLRVYCNYASADWSEYTSWDSQPYITEIAEINTDNNYFTVGELRLPDSPPEGYPNVDMTYLSMFAPLADSYKIIGSGGVSMGNAAAGDNAATLNYGHASGTGAFAPNGGSAKGYFSFACNQSSSEGYSSFAANNGRACKEKSVAFGDSTAYGGRSAAFNMGYTAGRAIKCVGFSSTERSITAAVGEDVSNLAENYILIRWKNNCNTIIHSYAKVLSTSGQNIYVDCDLGWGGFGEGLMPDGYIFRVEDYYSANTVFGWSMAGCNYSIVGGQYAMAAHEGATIFGKFGVSPAEYSWALANGTSFSGMGLAAKILQNGNMFIDGTYSSPCADYAELFEWVDGNPDNEDRAGYFVTLDGEKIRKANQNDTFILGVVSGNPAILGDSAELHWNGKYKTDDFGRVLYHDVTVPAVTEQREAKGDNGKPEMKTVVITEEHTESQPILNPGWDSSQEYIPRLQRKEWTAVGVLGKLVVYDDGSCVAGGLCKPNESGIAANAPGGYRVMKRVASDKVMIWFR